MVRVVHYDPFLGRLIFCAEDRNMKKIAMVGLLLVCGSANAISISGQAGKDYTHIGVGIGTETSGLAMKAMRQV